MPLTSLRELTLPTQKALTSRDQKTFLWRFHYSIEVGLHDKSQIRICMHLRASIRSIGTDGQSSANGGAQCCGRRRVCCECRASPSRARVAQCAARARELHAGAAHHHHRHRQSSTTRTCCPGTGCVG